MKRELNNRYLESLKPDPERRIEISDTKCAGLRFRLSPRGHASWVFEKRVKGGAKRKHSLGSWPETCSLKEARAKAREIEVESNKGIDRVELAKEAKAREEAEAANRVTVQQAIDIYSDLHLSTIKTGSERRRQLTQALSKQLNQSVSDLTRKDLQAAVDQKAQTGKRPYANRIRAALVAFANWAFVRGYVPDPIGAGVAKATKEKARERVLSLTEIRAIWAATWEMGELWGPYFRLTLLTGQRRGEIARLRWSEVDLEGKAIVKPGSETKNGRPHTTHLSEPALRDLIVLAEERSDAEFVFSVDGKRPVTNPSHAKRRLDDVIEGDVEPWRIHDIRTGFATAMAEAGESESVVDRILNHSASGSAPSAVARIYNQAEQLPQRAAALDRWAEMVTQDSATLVNLEQRN